MQPGRLGGKVYAVKSLEVVAVQQYGAELLDQSYQSPSLHNLCRSGWDGAWVQHPSLLVAGQFGLRTGYRMSNASC
jgi:hypothetical protein